MIIYYLASFAQGGYDDDAVNCEVRYEDDADPNIQGTYPAQPLDGKTVGTKYDNAKLCTLLSAQLGVTVQQAKNAKPKPAPEPVAEPIP